MPRVSTRAVPGQSLINPLACLLWLVCSTAAGGADGNPIPVSPGATTGSAVIEEKCPTFNWGGVAGAKGYELVIYRLESTPGVETATEEYRVELPGAAYGWTPSLDRCLRPGSRYAWSMRAFGEDSAGEQGWSEVSFFEVSAAFETATPGSQLDREQDAWEDGAPASGTTPQRAPRPTAVVAPPEAGSPAAEGPGEPTAEGVVGVSHGLRAEGGWAGVSGVGTVGVHGNGTHYGGLFESPVLIGKLPPWVCGSEPGDTVCPITQVCFLGECFDPAGGSTSGASLDVSSDSFSPVAALEQLGGGSLLTARTGGGGTVLEVLNDGTVTATAFVGDGSALTDVPAGDADELDGLDSTQFLRSDAADSFTGGTLTLDPGTTLDVNGALDAQGATALVLPSAGISGAGSGSGLDADTVDGKDGGDLLTHEVGSKSTGVGVDALSSLTTGTNNTAVGYGALKQNNGFGSTAVGTEALRLSTANFNTAFGSQALWSSTTGDQNTAIGGSTLALNTTGSRNVAVGLNSMGNNTTGNYNTAVGAEALKGSTNSSGFSNVAIGRFAMLANSTGSNNVALGNHAMDQARDGDGNVAIGRDSLFNNYAGDYNVAVGHKALSSSQQVTGNVALGAFALENSTSGYANAAVGYRALWKSTVGTQNTAIGSLTLQDNVGGSANVAVGSLALRANVSGLGNVAVGYSSLSSNTEAYVNVGVGHRSLEANTLGIANVGVGAYAMLYNTTGEYNVSIGGAALLSNTTGSNNTAVGLRALFDADSSGSTAVGYEALSGVTTGVDNVGLGRNTLSQVSTGDGNIAIGTGAGSSLSGGSAGNIMIGSHGAVGFEANTLRIGDDTGTGGTVIQNAFIHGIRGQTTGMNDAVAVLVDSEGQLGTISSSARYKEDVRDLGDVSRRLLDLRPVQFRYRKLFRDGSTPVQYGLIAEEVAEVFPQLVVYDSDGRPETVKYHLLATLLLNEFQKLVTEREGDYRRLERQEGEIAELRDRVDRLAGYVEASSPLRNARALSQSRCTVGRETPSASAVSTSVNPAK